MAQSATNSNTSDLYSFPVFGARYLTPTLAAHLRSARSNPYKNGTAVVQHFDWSNNEDVWVIPEPLTRGQKMRLEDCYVADPIVRRGLNLRAKFLLGKRTRTVVDVNKEFMKSDAQEQAIATTFNEGEVNELRTMIDKINTKVKFREKVEAAEIQCEVGGRSALLVERQGQMPVDLKVLNWGKLGKVYADKDTWRLLAVDYAERKREDGPFLAEDLIYFTNQDYHVSPDSLWHGLSTLIPVVDMSETIRFIVQEDLKESAKGSWAGYGLIKFPPGTNAAKMQEFSLGFKPGGYNATSQQVEIEMHDLDPKIDQLMKVVYDGRRVIAAGINVPEMLLGFEEVQNMATANVIINAWRESDLNHARSWLQGTIEPQWFDSLIKIRHPDIDIEDMKMKAKLEFEDITFETLKDKADAVLPLFQAGVIPLEKVLKILDMEDVLEQMLAKQKQMEKQRAQELEMMKIEREQQLAKQNQAGVGGNGNGNGRANTKAPKEEEDPIPTKAAMLARDKILEDIKQASLIPQGQFQTLKVPQVTQEQDTAIKRKLEQAEHQLRMQVLEKSMKTQEKLDEQISKMMAT